MSVSHQILHKLEGQTSMPDWFKKKLQQAYNEKDIFEIGFLNQCWNHHLNSK